MFTVDGSFWREEVALVQPTLYGYLAEGANLRDGKGHGEGERCMKIQRVLLARMQPSWSTMNTVIL